MTRYLYERKGKFECKKQNGLRPTSLIDDADVEKLSVPCFHLIAQSIKLAPTILLLAHAAKKQNGKARQGNETTQP